MAESCPITLETVDEHVARATAVWVVLLAIAFLVTPLKPVFYLLAADFAVRALWKPRYSPLAWLSRLTVRALRIGPAPTDAGPKRFAAKIGLVFSLTAALSATAGFTILAFVVAAGLLGAAALEAASGFCVGCKIYGLLPHHAPLPLPAAGKD